MQSFAALDSNLNRGIARQQPDQATPTHVTTPSSVPSSGATSIVYANVGKAPEPVGYSAILAALIVGFAGGVAVVVFIAGRRRGTRQI